MLSGIVLKDVMMPRSVIIDRVYVDGVFNDCPAIREVMYYGIAF